MNKTYYDNREFLDKCSRLITSFQSKMRDDNGNIHAINSIIYTQLIKRVKAAYKSHFSRTNNG